MGTQTLLVAVPSDTVQWQKTEILVSQIFPGKGLTVYFPSCCLRVQLLISLHLGVD